MSDGEFMYSDDDYDLEYSEDSTSEPDVDLENQYYSSKSLKANDPEAAIKSFQKVIDMQEDNKGVWGFKALKQIIKINFNLKNYNETMRKYKELLTYIKQVVTKNHSEKSINSILDYTSTSNNMEVLQTFYETTLDALKHAKNERLWFKTNLKLGKIYLARHEFQKLSTILKQLYRSCRTVNGEEDETKGTQLLEIYALEIQMHNEQKNNHLLKELYERSLKVKSAIPHPLIISIIRECGGKMHLRSEEYEEAYTDFFEAFKNYDESGSPKRMACLKYLVLTSMLMKSDINPFDSQEAKPYKLDPEIQAMTNLITAYHNSDLFSFQKIYNQNKNTFLVDPSIRELLEKLVNNVRIQVLLILIKPYSCIKLKYISQELNISEDDTEDLIVSCILNGHIQGRIDQINHTLIMCSGKKVTQLVNYNSIQSLITSINNINKRLTNST